MFTIDKITAARKLASGGNCAQARADLLAIKPELFLDSDKHGWRMAWRLVQELSGEMPYAH